MSAELECAIAEKTVAEESEPRWELVGTISYTLLKIRKKPCESGKLTFYKSGTVTKKKRSDWFWDLAAEDACETKPSRVMLRRT